MESPEPSELCRRAVELRSHFMPFAQIAHELGLSSPQEARDAVREGIGLAPAEDIVEVRRMEDRQQRRIGEQLRAIIENQPQPLVHSRPPA